MSRLFHFTAHDARFVHRTTHQALHSLMHTPSAEVSANAANVIQDLTAIADQVTPPHEGVVYLSKRSRQLLSLVFDDAEEVPTSLWGVYL